MNHRSPYCTAIPNYRDRRRAGPQRRGFAIILVLGLMVVAVALTYAMMRSQTMSTLVQTNLNRDIDAQQAAQAGMAIALRKMHDDSWPGFVSGDSSTISATLGANQSFSATYAMGDPRLTAMSPDYARFPFRVTVTSVGSAASSGNPQPTTHTIRAIVEMAPRQLATEPANWSTAQSYTVYQWPNGSTNQFHVELPAHIDGPVRIRSELKLSTAKASELIPVPRYLQDLTSMGNPDYRPFNRTVDLDFSYTIKKDRDLLTDKLNVIVRDTSNSGNALPDYGFSNASATYRLYPKGKLYVATPVSGQLSNVTIGPDPLTNPLGMLTANGSLTIGANVHLIGTLYSLFPIDFSGANATLEPVSLPALDGGARAIQLPVIATQSDITIQRGAYAAVTGLVFVGGKFDVPTAPQDSILFTLAGRLLTKDFHIARREEWANTDAWWQSQYTAFQSSGAPLFPVWLENVQGLHVLPSVLLGPPTGNASYHWRNAADTVYVAGSSDGGLRWNVVDWRDSP